ncbi:hypothetical protein [Legionella shakespearei]|uniref:Thaumatin domain-containing protein n=1 Tax=Legionella shakespearei DSM 23087 TaxID=1122169 RepID=A0A0W0YSX6_9GAMM|nr:hypothetical protein [Legionella shakespearei]KTD59924.1 hypothetical protein Lsha_1674 [Legionella shakespearei DSM 23087]
MSTKLITISGAVVLSLLTGVSAAGDIVCKDYNGKNTTVKPKTITIYNNSEDTIYPVLATSQNAVNEWLQGCFRSTDPYPTNFVYKLYVNEGKGIGSGESVTITLPLYSKLSDGQYITWWNGGRVVLADRNERLRDEDVDTALATPGEVLCKGEHNPCTLTTYSSKVQFPENIYAQLSEYTFGDSIIPAKQTLRLLKPENVGYNISYVDHVYLPVAIGAKNNPYIGYSGSAQPLAEFRSHLNSFLNTTIGQGWPIYNLEELKLPGGYNIFAQRSGTLPPTDNVPVKPKEGFPPVLTVLACKQGECTEEQKKSLHFGESVQRMQNLWANCVNWGSEDVSQYRTEVFECPDSMKKKLEAVHQFYKKNHEQYMAMYAAKQCTLTPNTPATPFNYWEAIKHIYGWVPFNEGCGAAANPLAETEIPGWDHAKIQSMYIHDLQYNYKEPEGDNPDYLFNPYVKLIHDNQYLDMDAYGFSVDDAVGFMSELGDGLVFTVGGTHGLENQKQFSYADGFSVAIGVPKSMENEASSPLIKKYGACLLKSVDDDTPCGQDKQDVIMPDNSQIAGFRIGTVASYPIKVSFTDLDDNIYTFVVREQFKACGDNAEPAECPANKLDIVVKGSCLVTDKNGQKHPKSDNWCANANPNQQKEKQVTKNFISFPKPVDFME